MLRVCRSRDEEEELIILIAEPSIDDIFANNSLGGLRRCPSIENLLELTVVERNRLEREAHIITE